MNPKIVRFSICVAAVYAVVLATPFLPAQDVPEPSSSMIRMRGISTDLSSPADTFLSLDLNGDGKTDLLYYRPGGGYASAYLSHGDGTFRSVTYTNNGTGYNGFPGDLSSSKDTFTPLDFNGDGKSDFIQYRPGAGYTSLCLSAGDGTVNCSALSTPGNQYKGFQDSMTNQDERIIAVDLNNDGRQDFIVYSPGGGLAGAYLSLQNGNVQGINLAANYAGNTSVGFQDDFKTHDVRIVPIDANGDGFTDLLVYAPQESEVRLYLNNKNNTFRVVNLASGGATRNGFFGRASNPNAHLIALDLNGDGKGDFLWWEAGAGTVNGYLSNGDGTFTYTGYLSGGLTGFGFVDTDGNTADTAVAIDLNGDGKSDFLWSSPGNGILTGYVSDAQGHLTAYQYQTPQGNRAGFNSNPSSSADQLLALNFLGQASSGFVWYTPGSGSLFLHAPYPGPTGPSSVSTYFTRTYAGSFQGDLAWSINNLPLKEIVMPGTHDSGMYAMTDGQNDINETQWGSSLQDQLNAGARSLDFRQGYFVDVNSGFYNPAGGIMIIDQVPAQTTSGYYMYGHSNTLSNVPTLTSLNEIEDWLIAHPSEVVIVELVNPNLSDYQRDATPGFAALFAQTHHPELIYSPMKACGAATCTNPNLQPPNVTLAKLMALNTRMIITRGSDELNAYGWTWGYVTSDVGYCDNHEGGRSTAIDEIDCINNASNESKSDAQSINDVRAPYRAADSFSSFMNLKAGLTPGGFASTGQVISLLPPLTLADGGEPYGFNVGSQQYDLKQQMANGAWNTNALNLWSIDGLRANDDLTRLILQRNNQTWTNMNFFNNNFAQPSGAISVGINGDVWAAGSGHSLSIFKYNPVTGAWASKINAQPNVKKLAVDAAGGVWVVDGSQGTSSPTGRLIHYDVNGQNANVTNSVVQDVAVGKNGSVWAMGQDGSIFEFSGPTDGSPDISGSVPRQYGTRLAIDNTGRPWVIDTNGYIQRLRDSSWHQVTDAQANEIVAGADGSIFVTGRNTPSIGRYNTQNNNFDFLLMDAAHIAVDGGGQPWAIRQGTGSVYKGALDQM